MTTVWYFHISSSFSITRQNLIWKRTIRQTNSSAKTIIHNASNQRSASLWQDYYNYLIPRIQYVSRKSIIIFLLTSSLASRWKHHRNNHLFWSYQEVFPLSTGKIKNKWYLRTNIAANSNKKTSYRFKLYLFALQICTSIQGYMIDC